MKICFVQKQPFPYFGVMALAGRLREAGIAAEALVAALEPDLPGALEACAPDVVGFSVLSTEHGWLVEAAALAKAALPGVPLVVGGVHAVLYPEAVLAIAAVDFVCTGEGEASLAALCLALRDGLPTDSIPGIAFRGGDGAPVIGARAPLLDALDGPPEDRMVYYRRYPMLRDDEQKQFIASRGCPHRCAFCFNDRLLDLFPGAWGRVRMKSPAHLVAEIEAARAVSPIRSIFFADDLFASDNRWLAEFGPIYRERIGIPFMCVTRADRVDAETARLLREAGCRTVSFGVESGSERIRRQILGKAIDDATIVRCAELLHAEGIRVQTSNMFCLPGETLDDALDTIRLNVRIRADFVFTPLFLPFPGTRLADDCIGKGYLPPAFGLSDLPQSFLTRSILSTPDRARIENLQRIAYFLVKHPWLVRFAEPVLRRTTASWPFYPFLFAGTLLRYKAERGLSLWGAARFLLRFRKSC
jgi:radical SAM superfamily enzyme YgiQ (UPF0313 family)